MGQVTKDRMTRLEKALDNWATCIFRLQEKLEKSEERIAELQSEVERLKRLGQLETK